MKRILVILLLAVVLLSAFFIPVLAANTGDDNATSGDGNTNDAAKGYAWYSSRQYLWKVTLYVGKRDYLTTQYNLISAFHRIGTVVMKKNDWTVPTGTKFGSGTKVDYYSGASLTLDTSPYIISDSNCPSVPIACDTGNIETVKAYFGSTGTVSTVLSGIAADKGTTKEAMLSELSFTIGGRTRTGWDYSYLDPNATTNRVPWVIVYEPMILMNLKDQETKLALTATEFALCQLNGWYDWAYSGGEGQGVSALTSRHLPTSVQLEESWFGYPVYAVTDDTQTWNYEDVVKGGGWGMRWMDVTIREPQAPLMDFGCYFSNANTTATVGRYTQYIINWRNYEDTDGTVLCELYLGDQRVWSEWLTIEGGDYISTTVSVRFPATGQQTLTAYINWEYREDETDTQDNWRQVIVNVQSATATNTDYGVSFVSVEQPDQDDYGTVTVRWRNWKSSSGTVLCELYLDSACIWSGYKIIGGNSYVDSSYEVYYSGTSTKTLEARINYANKDSETDPSDNRVTKTVTPTKTKDDTFDFSVSSLTVTPTTMYQGEGITLTFITDNWNKDIAYTDILIEVLIGNTVATTEYVDYAAYGRYRHTYTIQMTKYGTQNVTVRINWSQRSAEDNQTNNSVSTTVTSNKNYDFYVYDLKATPITVYELETVQLTFSTKNLDLYNSYEDIKVEVLVDGRVITERVLDYPAGGGFNHTWELNVGNSVGNHTIVVRVNWENKSTEKNTGNNITGSQSYTVKEMRDLSIQTITPNASYPIGTTVITSFYIVNNSRHDVLPSHNNTVTFQAYYYNGSKKVIVSSQTWNQAVIPAYNCNLVYFKWTAPSDYLGTTIYCTATVNADTTITEKVYGNNTTTLMHTLTGVSYSKTPDTDFEKEKPNGYTIPAAPTVKTGKATWNMWVYENGSFIEKNYSIAISSTAPSIQPDSNSPSYGYVDGCWQMRSGYGLYLSYQPAITTVSGYLRPPASAYTDIQRVYAVFPEFGYSVAYNKFRVLEKVNGNWSFPINASADGRSRIHFTPLWFPNGNYIVSVVATEVWTPAGMISSVKNSNIIRIVGSAYDDWYVGEL